MRCIRLENDYRGGPSVHPWLKVLEVKTKFFCATRKTLKQWTLRPQPNHNFSMENLIAGIFGLVIGVVGVLTGFSLLKKRAQFNQWKTTKGKVIERGTYQPDIPMLSAPAFRYAPLVRYEYQVAGKNFVSNSILPKRIQAPQHSTIKWAKKKADSFPDEVTVYYNPEDPFETYLVMTSKTVLYIVIAAASLVILVGLIFLLATFS